MKKVLNSVNFCFSPFTAETEKDRNRAVSFIRQNREGRSEAETATNADGIGVWPEVDARVDGQQDGRDGQASARASLEGQATSEEEALAEELGQQHPAVDSGGASGGGQGDGAAQHRVAEEVPAGTREQVHPLASL